MYNTSAEILILNDLTNFPWQTITIHFSYQKRLICLTCRWIKCIIQYEGGTEKMVGLYELEITDFKFIHQNCERKINNFKKKISKA